MNDIKTLLTRCRKLGAEFIPQPDGKLKVRAPAPLPESLQVALKQNKAEVLALLTSTAYRALYAERVESVKEDCFAIDPFALIDRHPELWDEMVTLDAILSRIEREEASEVDYDKALQRLCEVVRQVRALMEQERRQDRAAS